jgi:hypothetical protein
MVGMQDSPATLQTFEERQLVAVASGHVVVDPVDQATDLMSASKAEFLNIIYKKALAA